MTSFKVELRYTDACGCKKTENPKNKQNDLTNEVPNLLLNGVICLGLTVQQRQESGHLWPKPAHSQQDDMVDFTGQSPSEEILENRTRNSGPDVIPRFPAAVLILLLERS